MINKTEIPDYYGGLYYGYYASKDDCILYMYTNSNEEDYENYLRSLSADGFICYDRYDIVGNLHATYIKKDTCLVQVYFTPDDRTVRIIVDPNMDLYRREQYSGDNTDMSDETGKVHKFSETGKIDKFSETGGCAKSEGKTVLYQVKIDFTNIDCGMCYVTRCADGSFFIIDSAHRYSENFHIQLHDFLRSMTPEDRQITIAGWFFSHAHQDHIEKFMDFIRMGYNDIEIKDLYYNFPALTTEGNENWKQEDKVTMQEFDTLISGHKEFNTVKLHTGQHFYIHNLEFEVLATHEDIYPQSLKRFNDSSTVIRMNVEGCTTLFLGDANIIESEVLLRRYGAYLKSDIVQVSHHGFNGATVELYEAVDADVALFPVASRDLEKNLYREPNKKVLEMCKEYYLSGEGTFALEMPYQTGTTKIK